MSQVHLSESFENNLEAVTSTANNRCLIHIWSEIKLFVFICWVSEDFLNFIINDSVITKIWCGEALPWKTVFLLQVWACLQVVQLSEHQLVSFFDFLRFYIHPELSIALDFFGVFILKSPAFELLVILFRKDILIICGFLIVPVLILDHNKQEVPWNDSNQMVLIVPDWECSMLSVLIIEDLGDGAELFN